MTNTFSKVAVGLVLALTDCTHGQSVGASTNLDAKDLPKLLQSIRPLIEKGYGEPEIQALQHLADSLPVKETDVKTFSITYRGNNTSLRVELKKSDVDAIDIWFISQHELESEILKKMKELQQ